MATKLYLLNLSGPGDTELKLVDKETWDWIFSPWPFIGTKTRSGTDPYTPEGVKARMENSDDVHITRGSWENDRALQAPAAVFNGQEIHWFGSIKGLNKFMKDNDIEIEDEYEGCLY
jgi:hypothetical protein